MAYASAITFAGLRTKISKKLIDANQSAVSDSDVGDALNDALHYWKQKRFWFNEGQNSVTLGANNPYVLGYGNSQPSGFANAAPVLPQDFLFEFERDGFVIPYANLSYRFDKVNPADLDDASTSGYGIPYIYCFRNGNYEFYYRPNLAYTLQINYVKDVADFVNDAETNVFSQYADRLLMYEALSHLFGENRQDASQDNLFASKAEREFRLLKKRSSSNVASGKLSFYSILS